MSHLAHRPSLRTLLATTPPRLPAWLVRLVPLAVVAVLGCMEREPDVSGVGDERTASDETGGDETGGDETGSDKTDELALPGDDPLDRLATECEQRFSCGCTSDRFTDVAACEEYYQVDWAGIAAKAEEAELVADFECYMRWMPYETFGCDSFTEHYEQAMPQACSYCHYAYGERQVGEPCQDFGGGVEDCAQGLLCFPNAQGDPECIDPCSQAGAGESCSYLACTDGLVCDWNDLTCHTAGGEGELCFDGVCDDGLLCDWNTDVCTQGAGPGEACESGPCADGLFCDGHVCVEPAGEGEACESVPCLNEWVCDGQVCTAPASQGESCAIVPCGSGLVCRWDDATCDVPGQEGASCIEVECASGLICDGVLGTCVPYGAVGESCLGRPCLDGLTCDYETMTCATYPGLGEPCFDVCAGDLLCNYDVDPAVCAALPVAGEPCLYGGCAANYVCDPETNHCVDEPPAVCSL